MDNVTPSWFQEQRFGLFLHLNLASVPAFSPVGEYSDWYWSHMSPTLLPDVVLHPAPMPEVLQHHTAHYGDAPFDDFLGRLDFSAYDGAALAQLAIDAGMRYVVPVVKHHDGFCWFDTALTTRSSMHHGPRRDLVGELALASRSRGLTFGLYYSLLDWAREDYGEDAYVERYLLPQLRELVERYEPAVLWGDGHWGRPPSYWRSEQIVRDYYDAMSERGLEAAVNDRWGSTESDFITFEYDVPAEPPGVPFELCRGIGHSFAWNRAEQQRDHLNGAQIVALLAETVAKGGNLLLNVGLAPDGTVPDLQLQPLLTAGAWVRAHADAIHGSVPFDLWGSRDAVYTVTPGAEGGELVNVMDLACRREAVLTELGGDTTEVLEVQGAADVRVEPGALLLRPQVLPSDGLPPVYRVRLRRRERQRAAVRATPVEVTVDGRRFSSVGEGLAAARPGDVVRVGPGTATGATETFPLQVPAGVVLSGAGAGVTVLDAGASQAVGSAIGGTDSSAALTAVVRLAGPGAGLRDVTVAGAQRESFLMPPVAVLAVDADGVDVSGVHAEAGAVVLRGGHGGRVEGCRLTGAGVRLEGTVDAIVRGSVQGGDRWGTGIAVEGGSGALVVGNDVSDDLTGIAVRAHSGARLIGNDVRTRWWGLHLDSSVGTAVDGGTVRDTMRAVCVTGGSGTVLRGAAVSDCDTGVLAEAGTSGLAVERSWFHGCRIALFLWDCEQPELTGTVVRESREAAAYVGEGLEVHEADLGGAQVLRL